jgi:pilus assembly protein CpaB
MMRRYAPFIILAVGIILALAAGILTYGRLKGAAKVKGEVVPAVPVAVAAKDIPWGTKLAPEMIKLISLPKDALPPGYFSSPEVLKERVLLAEIRENEPILEHRLAPISVTAGGLAAVLNPEKRAMSIRVDDVVGVAGFLYPGNRVDVFVSMREEASGISGPLSKIVLQNILVLAAGTEMERKVKEEKPVQVTVVTLEVTPEEGEKLVLAANTGKLQLALRNPLSADEVVTTSGATIPALLASARTEQAPVTGRKETAKVPGGFTVEIIKGDAVSTQGF